MPNYQFVSQIKYANKQAGYHFFDPETLQYFKSRIGTTVYGGNMFITSEQHDNSPRMYTIRKIEDNGDITNIGEFQQYRTSAQATAAVKKMVKRLEQVDYTPETKEVILVLGNDEECYNLCLGQGADFLQAFVTVERKAPTKLYKAFATSKYSFDSVNWQDVADYINGK